MTGTDTRVYVACQPVCRAGLRELLEGLGFEVVEISDGDRDVVPEVRRSGAEMAILDVGRPGVDVARVLAQLSRGEPGVRVVFGSHAPASPDLFMAIESGAAGFVALDSPLEELRQDLDRARSGGPTVSARFEHVLMDEIRERGGSSEQRTLTPRQATIIKLVADGHPTQKIAEVLSISPLTVKSHYSGINRTLGVSSKAAAVAEAFRRGILA